MKVLFGYRYGILGGVATQLVNRMHYLRTVPGFEAEFVFLEDHGVAPTLEPYGRVHFVAGAKEAARLAEAGRFDVAAIIDTKELLEALSAPPRRHALICEVHTTVEFGLRYLAERSWRADLTIVPSRYSKELIQRRFQIGDALEIVPNIVDPQLFAPLAVDPPERPILVWVGKLDDHKNWQTYLEVAGAIALAAPEVEFWIIGGETAPEPVGLSMLHAADGLGILHRLRWFPRVDYRSMRRVFAYVAAGGGCALATTKDESFGMSIAEALLSGCPAIASEVGAIPELAPGRPYLELYPFADAAAATDAVLGYLRPERGLIARAALARDLPELRARFEPAAVGPIYLAALEKARRLI